MYAWCLAGSACIEEAISNTCRGTLGNTETKESHLHKDATVHDSSLCVFREAAEFCVDAARRVELDPCCWRAGLFASKRRGSPVERFEVRGEEHTFLLQELVPGLFIGRSSAPESDTEALRDAAPTVHVDHEKSDKNETSDCFSEEGMAGMALELEELQIRHIVRLSQVAQVATGTPTGSLIGIELYELKEGGEGREVRRMELREMREGEGESEEPSEQSPSQVRKLPVMEAVDMAHDLFMGNLSDSDLSRVKQGEELGLRLLRSNLLLLPSTCEDGELCTTVAAGVVATAFQQLV